MVIFLSFFLSFFIFSSFIKINIIKIIILDSIGNLLFDLYSLYDAKMLVDGDKLDLDLRLNDVPHGTIQFSLNLQLLI